MTSDQRRIVIAVCVIYFLSLLMIGGLAFLITPMADDLNLKNGTVQYILAIPSVVALVVVFSPGRSPRASVPAARSSSLGWDSVLARSSCVPPPVRC